VECREFISVCEIGYNRRRLQYFEKAFLGYLEPSLKFLTIKKRPPFRWSQMII